jgi:hypothetical protein
MPINVRTHSGQELDLENPDPRQILLSDICWSLAGQNRWNAHGCKEYYVSDHVQFVAHLVKQDPKHTPADVVEALIHDAQEAYESDIPEPVRQYLRKRTNALDDLSDKLSFQIRKSVQFSHGRRGLVDGCDLKARSIESAELFLNQKTSLMYFGDRNSQANRAAMLQDAINFALADYYPTVKREQKPADHSVDIRYTATVRSPFHSFFIEATKRAAEKLIDSNIRAKSAEQLGEALRKYRKCHPDKVVRLEVSETF